MGVHAIGVSCQQFIGCCQLDNAAVVHRNTVVGKYDVVWRDGQYPGSAEEKFWGLHGGSIASRGIAVLVLLNALASPESA